MIYSKTETILTPKDTEIRCEAWIIDADYALKPNRYNEYELTFQPYNQHDYGRIKEVVNTALRDVDYYSPEMAATDATETNDGYFKCSQLFLPKVNKELFYPEMELLNKQVSLKLHLRDDPVGKVYLQCSYIDLYEEDTRTQFEIDMEENPNQPPDDIDW